MPDSTHTDRSPRDLEREIAERRAHLAESIERLEHVAREKLDVRARVEVARAKAEQEVRQRPWPFVGGAFGAGLLIGLIAFR